MTRYLDNLIVVLHVFVSLAFTLYLIGDTDFQIHIMIMGSIVATVILQLVRSIL